MKHQNLQTRTKQFALQVIKFCEGVSKDDTSRVITRQLLRSGTSVGANYRAACRSKSKPAFISKMGDVKKPTNRDTGSSSWLTLPKCTHKLRRLCLPSQKNLSPLQCRPSTPRSGIPIWTIDSTRRKSMGPEGTLHYALCILHDPPAHAISTKNKHLLLSCDTNPRFHGGSFGVLGHTSCKALKL